MLNEITDELVRVLQGGLPDVPPARIGTARPDLKKGAKLPAISVSSDAFTLQDGGVGGGGTDVISEAEERLSGDGAKRSFTLSGKPIRPLLRVESPVGTLKTEEDGDYGVDYAKGVVIFGAPPPRGRENVLVKYRAAGTSGETKYVRMSITYNVDVWATAERERDDLTMDVIKAIALSEESLAMKGMRITPSQGLNLEQGEGEAFAKRLIYSVEANLRATTPVPRIERIEIEQKPPE